MSVTLTTAPPPFAFSRNDILATLTSDDVIDTAGVAAVNYITFSGAISGGNSLQLVWTRGNLVMTAGATANTSKQFPSGDGSAGYVASLIPYFEHNFYIDRDFIVTSAGSVLILTARAKGIDGNIVPESSGNMALTVHTSGVNQVLKPNFKHWLEIWLDSAQVYACSLGLEPGTAITTKDLSELLGPEMALTGSDKPSLTATGWQACPNTLKPYYIRYAQYYGDSPEVQRLYTSATAYVNRGGLDVDSALGQTMTGFIRPDSNNPDTICLRQGSKKMLIQLDQPEFLYWINLTGADIDIKLRVQLNYSNGQSGFFYLYAFTALANNKYYVPVGFNTLSIQARIPSGKTLQSYTVRICDAAGSFLSAAYTYVPDQYREWPHYFIYLNSLGGYQTLYTRGKAKPKTTRAKQDIEKQVTYAQAAISGRKQETNIRLQRSVVVNTGYSTRRDIELLNDFLASEERYFVDRGRLIPIGISSDTLDLPEDGENLNAAQFEFYPLSDNWVFTDDPAQADLTIGDGGGGLASEPNTIVDNGTVTDPTYTVIS